LKERRAKIKAAKQVKKQEEFKKIQDEAAERQARDIAAKNELKENLKNTEGEAEDDAAYVE